MNVSQLLNVVILVSDQGGRIGVVLPRSALAAKGSTEFRLEIFEHADEVDITMLLNNRQWFFEDVHPQYTIGLVALQKRQTERTPVALRGPYASLDRYHGGVVCEPAVFSGDEVKDWNDTAALPLLPSDESVEVFVQLRKAPRLDLDHGTSWRIRPYAELHATNNKDLMDFGVNDVTPGYWPVYKGESFDLWAPDTGTYYAWAKVEVVVAKLQGKRVRAGRNKRSPFYEFDKEFLSDIRTLSCHSPRIAFRNVARSTDSRTIRAALIPPEVFISHAAPFFLWPRGNRSDEAYFLGIFSSLILDWYARRFVEINLTFDVINPLPIPRPDKDSQLRSRVIQLAGQLACPDERFAHWAEEVGVDCGPLEADDKEDKIHELDAVVVHLYGLKEKHLVHIFETFHEGWDYEERLRPTLKHFHDWRKRL